ncbi:helix-turn-helix domain containing protein [Streptomyces sp. MI02-2A]|uniref:TetR/AcrR family transcriptional regulator n=1 Tax=unclassified Streptomyces TaxID=2593676 RepID=UPI0029B1B2B4|nr:helix-turn-helix domain-containing protein [Streptomyces sp. MI02-2A]MDX3264830.1 helix-turn-helix domain containing protein [Streptomyces sp. MI02-2A]
MAGAGHRRGSDTKAQIRKVAIELFTEQGYEATSLREIAERLGITKAALYYHFSSKEDIVRSLFTEHLDALDSLVAWAREQPPGPDLRTRAVDRMVDMVTGSGMSVMRFALANQRVVRDLHPGRENAFERLTELFEIVAGPDASLEEQLRLRAALLSVNTVLLAAQGLKMSDERVAAVARGIAHQLVPPVTEDASAESGPWLT